MSNSQAFILPTMFPSNYTGMDIPVGPTPVNDFEVRGRTSSTNKNYSRDLFIFATWLSVIYHERMANNGMDVDSEPVNKSPALSCRTEQEKAKHFSKVIETLGNTRPQEGNNKTTTSNPKRVFNMNQSKCPLHGTASQTDDNNIINI